MFSAEFAEIRCSIDGILAIGPGRNQRSSGKLLPGVFGPYILLEA